MMPENIEREKTCNLRHNRVKITLYRGFPGKPPGGGVFFHHFQLRLAEKKTPPHYPSFVKSKENQGFSNKEKCEVGFFSTAFN